MPATNALFNGKPLVSDQVNASQLAIICRELEQAFAAGIRGQVAEFGCYNGTTSLFLRRTLDAVRSDKQLHVYDSFEGLPPKAPADDSPAGLEFVAGELAVSKKMLLRNFQAANLAPPIVHKGWFDQLTAKDVPEELCFAFLDGDFYDSILSSLRLAWPRLQPGGRLLLDDYKREALPGVERAVADYFNETTAPDVRLEKGVGILRK